jgi:hypothetical protein
MCTSNCYWSPVSTPEIAEEYPLILTTGGRTKSYTHSQARFLEIARDREPQLRLQIHPADAEARGVQEGDWIEISSPVGVIEMIRLPLAQRTSFSGPPITWIAIPVVAGRGDVSVRWNLERYARTADFFVTSVADPITARRFEIAVRRDFDRDAGLAVLPEAVAAFPVGPRTREETFERYLHEHTVLAALLESAIAFPVISVAVQICIRRNLDSYARLADFLIAAIALPTGSMGIQEGVRWYGD